MKVTYKALNKMTGLIDTIHVQDVRTIREDSDSYYLANETGMLMLNDIAIIGETPTLRIFKGHIEKISITK